jgi:hypothetical protein
LCANAIKIGTMSEQNRTVAAVYDRRIIRPEFCDGHRPPLQTKSGSYNGGVYHG